MPLNQTSGNVTTDAYGGGVAAQVKYIENYFQTWLRTGTGASATVTTGLDASTNKALVWTKSRSAATDHKLTDTVRGATKALISDTTGAQTTDTNGLTAFSSTGYTIGTDTNYNNSGATYVDWEFVATPKFFDIVTYTGTGSNATISHNLGSVPGCIIVKRTDGGGGNWAVYHRGTSAGNKYLFLNRTDAEDSGFFWNPTSTTFDISYVLGLTATGGTYVAYLFAHNAGGFGLTGTDNVISCGSFTYSGSAVEVNLGYEPQFIIAKGANQVIGWEMYDVMRGMPAGTGSNTAQLVPNTTAAETVAGYPYHPTATGFIVDAGYYTNPTTVIYIAIRRGPMKVPTDATTVFAPITYTGTGAAGQVTGANFPPDLLWANSRNVGSNNPISADRLRGTDAWLIRSSTSAELTVSNVITSFGQNGIGVGTTAAGPINSSGQSNMFWMFGRAPSFFDEVCYTGTGANTTQTHNLGVVPELVIVKARSAGSTNWLVYPSSTSFGNALYLNTTTAYVGSGPVGAQSSTTVRFDYYGNPAYSASTSGTTYVAYLFATCAGVSKVGSYTGNGTTQTINCGFTGGARWVMVKRTDSTGDWYVYDTARGMTTLTDPYLLSNSAAAEVATLGSVTTVSTGFALNATILAAINTNGATYIYLSIA